jgi:chaperonin GroES
LIEARSDVVVIRRLPPSEVSDGGVLLAWDSDYKEDIGIVVSVGEGKQYGCKHCGTHTRRPVSVNVGDKVLFSTNGHQITIINGQELVVLREPSIIGVIVDVGSEKG